MDKVRRHLLWDVILEQVDDNLPNSMATIAELSDPNIFMLLTFNVELLNDLIFLDWLTDNNNYAFTYMAHTLQQLAVDSEKQTTARHMELPFYVNLLEYWKDLLSNSGDHMHPQDVFTFFAITKIKTENMKFQHELYSLWISAFHCISSSFCYEMQLLSRALYPSQLEKIQTKDS